MKMLFSENYSSTPTMKKVGQGTQKVKKVKKMKCHTIDKKHITKGFGGLRREFVELFNKQCGSNVSKCTV